MFFQIFNRISSWHVGNEIELIFEEKLLDLKTWLENGSGKVKRMFFYSQKQNCLFEINIFLTKKPFFLFHDLNQF